MSRTIVLSPCLFVLIFTSCAKTTRDVNNDEQVISKELSTKDATGKDIPEWVKGSLGEGTLFEKVDIDGIGGADDEVYIITGRFDDYGSDYRNGLTVVYVYLGTGEVLAQAILCKGNYETHFANLIPEHEGNQIILEITDGNSTSSCIPKSFWRRRLRCAAHPAPGYYLRSLGGIARYPCRRYGRGRCRSI